MKLTIVATAATTVLFGSLALSQNPPNSKNVTPSLSGSYLLQTKHFCQADIGQNGVVMLNSGDMNFDVATVYFSPSTITPTTTTGIATVSGIRVDGSALLLDGLQQGNILFTQLSNQQSLTYSNDATTFVINNGATTFNAYYANIDKKTGVPQFMIFGGVELHDNLPPCALTGMAILQ